MLICIISINKYTKYDSNKRFKELSGEEEEEKKKLLMKIKELNKLNQEFQDNFSSIQSHNRILQDQIDQLQLENIQLQQQLINGGNGSDNTTTNNNSNNNNTNDNCTIIGSLADELRQSNIFENQEIKQQKHEEEIKLIKEEMEKQLQSFSIQQQKSIQDKDKEIFEIKSEFQVKIVDLETLLSDRLELIKEYLTRIEELDQLVLVGEFKSNEKDKIIESIQQSINEKDFVIGKHVESIHSIQELLEVKENQLIEKDLEIKVKTKQLHEKDQLILEFESSIIEKDQLIKEKSELIQRQSNDIIELENTSSTKDQLIREKDDLIKEKQQLIKDRDQTIQEKVEIITNQTTSINELQSVTNDKDKIIKEKLDSIEEKLSIIRSLESSSINKVEQFESSIVEKDQIIIQLKKEIETIRFDLSNSKLTQDQLNKELEKLMSQFNQLELESQQRLQLLQEKDKLLQDKQIQTDQLNDSLVELQLKFSTITDIHSKCDSNLLLLSNGLNDRFNDLLDSFNNSLECYQLKFNRMGENYKEKCLEIKRLLLQTIEFEQIIEQLKLQIQELTTQHQQDKEKSELLIVELLDKKEEFDSIQIELTQLKSENQALQVKVEEKTRKHQVLKRELSMQMDAKKQEELEQEKKRQIQEQINRVVKPTQSKDYYIEEEEPLINYVNTIEQLLVDKHIKHVFPIDSTKHIIHSFYDGVLLCKLVNFARDGTIDERVLNIEPTSNIEIDQNLNLVFNSAKAIGCVIPSTISPTTLKSDPKEMVNLLYELVKVQITSSININTYPTLLVLKETHEDMKHFIVQSTNKLLLRWFIYHLALDKTKLSLDQLASSPSNLIKLFISLEKDLAANGGTALLQQSSVDQQSKESDEFKWIIEQSKQTFNIFQWLNLESIQNRNQKLIYLFLSSIFKSEKGIGIKASESSTKVIEEQRALVEKVNLDVEGTREERAFCMWMNSLNIKPYVNNLQQDLQDGLVILQMFDKIKSGSVNWKEVNISPSNAYMALENCNYGISIAKQLRFSLVGIGGKDIHDGNRKLTLALIWQACKYHLLSLLTNLRLSLLKDSSSGDLSLSSSSTSSTSSFFNEGEIIQWANKKVLKHGKSTCITGFKDQSIGNGIFLIDLLDSIQSVVNYSIITKGETFEEKKLNAQYIINVARKIGCCIFVVWEDLVEVKPKMILTFISMLMCFDQEQQQNLNNPQQFEKLQENNDCPL
ncbi:actin binding protein [Dictyostelium discoideum AX4]|uniref:Actin binding protein n=1 Tax=Dictyostelium discoideum TaxID=44689 RepID=Q54XX0_DICDI|nr:actin binding protein [Dictyostelium discoideum AX4]EAL68445.1 actin binding protein [Dictyostelium discoideum AX4]|eukprot:XP_642432.1 actin binding protein [Dictyostelium discoideum AX4]